MHARAFEQGGTRPLAERPGRLGTLTLARSRPDGFTLAVQPVYTGRASSPDDGVFVALPASLALNLRAAYRLTAERSVSGEVFIHINNATDALVLSQLGLPGAGREMRAGVSVSF